jgi:hypothetical protein
LISLDLKLALSVKAVGWTSPSLKKANGYLVILNGSVVWWAYTAVTVTEQLPGNAQIAILAGTAKAARFDPLSIFQNENHSLPLYRAFRPACTGLWSTLRQGW